MKSWSAWPLSSWCWRAPVWLSSMPLIFYVVWQILLVYSLQILPEKRDSKWIFYLHTALAILPLFWVKVEPAISGHQSLFWISGNFLSDLPLSWDDYWAEGWGADWFQPFGNSSALCSLCPLSLVAPLIVLNVSMKIISKFQSGMSFWICWSSRSSISCWAFSISSS